MIIFIGADHRGFRLKDKVEAYLAKRNYPVEDVGALTYDQADDFPQYAAAAALKIIGSDDDDPRAILLCGGGQGMAMAANRFHGIRAVVVSDAEAARQTRVHNNANVLCLAADIFDSRDEWQEIVDVWLGTAFSGKAQYERRNRQLDELS